MSYFNKKITKSIEILLFKSIEKLSPPDKGDLGGSLEGTQSSNTESKRKKENNKYVEYHNRHYIKKEVNLEEELMWNRYTVSTKEFKRQYKDISSDQIKEYLDIL